MFFSLIFGPYYFLLKKNNKQLFHSFIRQVLISVFKSSNEKKDIDGDWENTSHEKVVIKGACGLTNGRMTKVAVARAKNAATKV